MHGSTLAPNRFGGEAFLGDDNFAVGGVLVQGVGSGVGQGEVAD